MSPFVSIRCVYTFVYTSSVLKNEALMCSITYRVSSTPTLSAIFFSRVAPSGAEPLIDLSKTWKAAEQIESMASQTGMKVSAKTMIDASKRCLR